MFHIYVMESVRTTLFLPQLTHRQLKVLAHQRGTSMAQLIQKALEETYFRRQRKTAKELWGSVAGDSIPFAEFQKIKKTLNPK